MYTEDGRAPLQVLSERYDELATKYGFEKALIYTVDDEIVNTSTVVTSYGYRSALSGPAIWILSGVHGEEPAGPLAIARAIDDLGPLGHNVPLVILPLLNPLGYAKNWRYPDERRDWHLGHSVSDSEHLLPDLHDPQRPRAAFPGSEIASKVTQFVLQTMIDYPPVLTLDHHEDEQFERGYIYSQGPVGAGDAVTREVMRALAASGLPLATQGLTRFGERIEAGVVVDQSGLGVRDGSIDELLAARTIIVAGQVVKKPGALAALVIETPIIRVLLETRIRAHAEILIRLSALWALANQ